MTNEQFQQFKRELKDNNVKVISRPIKSLSSKIYCITFPLLTGGECQLKKEKELRNKLLQFKY